MKSANLTLLGCSLMTLVLGSIHAFSVFMIPLESLLDAPRSHISLIYSTALLSLTFTVLIGHRIYPILAPPLLGLVSCFIAALGIFIAGHSDSFAVVALGYALIFGGANGVGYGFALQLGAQAMPQSKGFAMGLVTACYAVGAALAPSVFESGLASGGISDAMNAAAIIFIITGIVVYVLLRISNATFKVDAESSSSFQDKSIKTQMLLWVAYGSGSATGLMVIGHAVGIIRSYGGTTEQGIIAIMLIAIGNMTGGLIAGWLADRLSIKKLLIALPVLSALATGLLIISTQIQVLLFGLLIIGFCYGAIIAIYPVVVLIIFGASASSKIYGRVFTAWGLVGLIGPWLAGYLFDQYSGYAMALLIAGLASLISLTTVVCIKSISAYQN